MKMDLTTKTQRTPGRLSFRREEQWVLYVLGDFVVQVIFTNSPELT